MSNATQSDTTWLQHLQLLCAQPTVTGHARALANGTDSVAAILRDCGLDCRIVQTPGAPVVIGQYAAGSDHTLLIYGRYDVPAPGAHHTWTSDPFQPTLRNNALCARGAVVKAELVARAAAVRALIKQRPSINIVFVAEGESLIGSPHLGTVGDQFGPTTLCLWSGGGFDARNVPLLYTGVKGLLQVRINSTPAATNVPASYAATVPNPLWRITLALSSTKSEFEEILIDGFYDEIAAPSREASSALQTVEIDEQARRSAWGVDRFVAGVSGRMLARTETFSPACTISAINVVSAGAGSIPQHASADLEFQLVPDLQPARLFKLLKDHLHARGLDDLVVQQRPGAYPPLQSAPLTFDPSRTAMPLYGQPAAVLPFAPFAAPAALLTSGALLSCGLQRPTSNLHAADEHVPLADLHDHTRLVSQLLMRMVV